LRGIIRRFAIIVVIATSFVFTGRTSALTRAQAAATQQSAKLGTAVNEALGAAYEKAKSGDFDQASAQADQAFGWLVAYGSASNEQAFRDAAFARRLLSQLKKLEEPTRSDLFAYLRAHDEIAQMMAFGLADGKDGKDAYQLLDRLRKKYPAAVEKLPNLAVAISLTHDKKIELHLNENKVTSTDPLALFEYFGRNENRMFFGLRNVPVELLVYIVDTTATVPELQWALDRYAGRQMIGTVFFDVAYDYQSFSRGADKKVTAAGYNLPNLLRYGGVCVDQAYFAEQVGKAIGVPTATAVGSSSEAGHAWVGFLQLVGKQGKWNFDSGRYDAYQHIRGDVRDPQTGAALPDSCVSILAEAIGSDPVARQAAAAYVDAAKTIIRLGKVATDAPPGTSAGRLPPPREADAAAALGLIEMGLRRSESYFPGWLAVGELARHEKMTLAQKRRWADLVQQLCGQKYPDFALSILIPMVQTVDDPDVQVGIWEKAFQAFTLRPDLAADLRMCEAQLFETKHEYAKAGECYTDVIRRFVNVTPQAVEAVAKAEEMLNKMNQSAKVLELYRWAASLAIRPGQTINSPFEKETNWYRLNEAYKRKLAQSNQRGH
jgi:hypothetical protein